ncbi:MULTISPECIES: hypothetical protein [unclassified Methylobacterium]|uniref:hypothetical protein n=1 Tax=unclassified Methylobacterium TaxID=2615210 RepID=UPI0006FF2A2D|nr:MULTISPECIES: hypothetical protein [unclassified Methylobacterium]KQO54469.1 hypothetical protein ASF24_21475 [Methylobacterium sp. Leaf86]KQO90511.1 hypothetical protein ASF32_05290 [Methylobacterium sp. Leaf91]
MTAPVAHFTLSAFALAGALLGTSILATSAQAGGCGGAECYRHVTTPPVYDTVSERVLVRPARTVYRSIPPVFETVAEQVQLSPGGRVWQTRRDAYGQMIGCWVDVPPRFATRHRRILAQPGQTIPETIPAEYASVQRTVLVSRGRSGWVPAHGGGYRSGYAGSPRAPLIGSIPDAFGITGASSADVGVGLGFSTGSIYDGY